ncbi:MAG: adenosylcobalamin-dependent ribonucleoside-diphosphate reductase [Candidatus Omnitrophota bacterium]
MELKLSSNAVKVLERRYLSKDEEGRLIETPEEMFHRVARAIAQADKLYGKNEQEIKELEDAFHRIMTALEFIPNSPCLMNAGKDLGQLSACFVLPIEDSMDSIFETLKATAMIHKSGGGTGFSFSRLRPRNAVVKTTGGIASGPVSFMRVYDAATEAVKQGGCVAPTTRISTEFGIVKIKSLGPKELESNSWKPHNGRPFAVATDKGIEVSDEFYNNGVAKVKNIKTACGYNVTATLEHRFRIIDEDGNYVWKHVKDIRSGDWIALQKNTYFTKGGYPLPKCSFEKHYNAREIKTPGLATKEFGEFVGFFVGDGAISINERGTGRLIFTINDEDKDTRDYLYRITKELFGIEPALQKKKQDKSTNYFFNSTVLVHWLSQIGIGKPSALEADIPEIVFRAGRDFACGFLRGLFSADGFISDEGYVSLASVSEKLIANTQLLLLSLGMPGRISVSKNRNGAFGTNPLYRLSIITKAGIGAFRKEIGFISGQKNKRLKDFTEKAWEFNDVIPNQEKLLERIYDGPGRGCVKNRGKKGANRLLYRDIQHYLAAMSSRRHLTRSRLETLSKKHIAIKNDPTVQWFLANNQFYDKVAGIDEAESLTLDLSVPNNNTYIANGFVSHNTRRGANMGILRVDHPDIMQFITCKENNNQITNFNISVAVTDDFMDKLSKCEDYDLIDPHTHKPVQKLNAKEVFDLIVKQAHKNGEPGIIFIDRMNQYNPTPKLGVYESTNPCGEQVLLPYESCDLGSINLSLMLKRAGNRYEIDWEKLRSVTQLAVHFLDNIIDLNKYPLPQIEKATKLTRKIGLGIMGWASLLIRLNIPYNSEEAVALAEKIMSFILSEATKKSLELGKTKGVFPAFKGSIYDKKEGAARMRNATLTTIAPTGTISIIAGPCSSGIEPLFAISYYRNVMDNDKLVEVDPLFEEIAKERGFYSRALMEKIAEKSSLQEIEEIPEDIKRVFVTSHDITPQWHVRMQAAFQKYVHNATSKTINFPHEATVEDVRKSYLLAYESGCKGITIYRDRSREEQVLNVGKPKQNEAEKLSVFLEEIAPRPRPEVIIGTTTKVATGCGNLYVTINVDEEGKPFELFTQMGKAGGCAASQLEAIGRLVSLGFRSGIEVKSIIEQLRNIRCPSPSWEKGQRIFSCADAIARVIEKRLADPAATKVSVEAAAAVAMKHSHEDERINLDSVGAHHGDIIGVCPDCGGAVHHEEGCVKCHACGFSKC